MKITDIEVNESIELGDNFDIELGNTIIESRVVGFMDDGVVLEADDKALALLGMGGALLESVGITEVSLGDYSKKAQISRALAQIDQKFYPDKPGSEQTIAKRTRGLERAKVRSDQAKAKYAAQAQQARADAIAKDRENLPTLEKYLAQLQSEYDPYYEYSDDHSVWTKNRELKAKISALERRIKNAKGVAEGDKHYSNTKNPVDFPKTWHDVDKKLGKAVDKMSQAEKVKKGLAHPDTLKKKGVAEGTNVTDYNPKSQGGTRKELLAKYHNTKDPKDAEAARKAGATQKELRGVVEGMFGIDDKIKGRIQNVVSDLSDIPGMWDHKAQTLTDAGMDKLKTVLKNNPKYIKYALNLTYKDYEAEGVAEGRMKEQMHTDAERMELAEFVDKYGDEDWVKEFWHNINDDINEAKYQGREVPLGKPMAGDVKKSKVYVRGPKGNVVKVNFGDKNMRIKKSNPKRRKSFRARHNCANPGPRWKARYWSCRAW